MKKVILALAAMAISGAAVAGPKWSYVDLAYTQASSSEDLDTKDAKGYELLGSWGFADIWHISAFYGSAEVDFVSGGTDEVDKSYNITGGIHPAVTDNTDFVAEIGYTQWDVKFDGVSTTAEATAYDLTVGIRSMIGDALELNAFLSSQSGSTDSGSSDDDFNNFVPSVGGQYFFTDNFSINLAYAWTNTESLVLSSKDQARFGVRWSF